MKGSLIRHALVEVYLLTKMQVDVYDHMGLVPKSLEVAGIVKNLVNYAFNVCPFPFLASPELSPTVGTICDVIWNEPGPVRSLPHTPHGWMMSVGTDRGICASLPLLCCS